MQPAQEAQMKAGDAMVTVVTENVSGVQVVKAFATENTEIAKFNRAADAYFEKVMATVRLWRNFVPVIRGIAGASQVALFAAGAVLVVMTAGLAEGDGHKVKVGDLLIFGIAMSQILS